MPDWTMIAIVLPTLVVAYIIFGIAGFGTALVAAPILAHAMPIASVVPLLALLDFGAAALNGFTAQRQDRKSRALLAGAADDRGQHRRRDAADLAAGDTA